jgi:hypothetical protein
MVPVCVYQGDTIPCITLRNIYVYPRLRFKSKKQERYYYKLVRDVKKTLPLAKEINRAVIETYEYLQTLPNDKARTRHIKMVEKGLKEQYTPRMKKLTFAQGKLLIKLVNRECNQSSYQLVKAFMGPFKAGFYQAFAALFGTPMAAAVFALEVVSVGVMYYTALMPCMIASLVASGFAAGMGVTPETFHVVDIPKLTIETGLKMGAIAVGCAVISIVFCMVLNGVAGAYGRWFKNPYVRVVVGSCLVIGITLLLGTSDYMGAGAELIEKAVEEGQARPLDFFWKLVLTALTMRAGFRGGEIVPSFCIGATLGCVMGNWLGFSPSICAACGMTAVFCGVTNCPITSILIAFEMFGFKGVPFYLIAVSISYAASGYYGLYKDQTIVYSKYKAKYVNKPTRF